MIQLDDEVDAFCRPDRSQMIPFKPRRFPAPGSHPVQGGEYPMPEGELILDQLISSLNVIGFLILI